MTTLLFLDDYHVGDPQFLADLGRRLAKLGAEGRTVIVHGAEEAVRRELESTSPSPRPGDRATVVERVVRETNQGITRRLIEEGVPAVSIHGSDRGLLTRTDSIRFGEADWLVGSVRLGAVPVISPLVRDGSAVEFGAPSDCAAAIAELFAANDAVQGVIFCSNRKSGLFANGHMIESVDASDLERFSDVIDVVAARRLARSLGRLIAANSAAIDGKEPIRGSLITATNLS